MTLNKKVSLVIPSYQGREVIEDCMNSLRAQTDTNFETILVDNATTDGTWELVEKKYPEVKIVYEPFHVGVAKAFNDGIRASSGERIVILNDDTRADPNWLCALNEALDRRPEMEICAPLVLYADGSDRVDTAGDILGIGEAHKRGDGKNRKAYENEEEVFSACCCGAIFRKSVFERIGFFDESFGSNMEDVDLGFRAQLAGIRCLYVPHAVIYHRVGYTKKLIGFRSRLTARNSAFMWLKNAPAPLLFHYARPWIFKQLRPLAWSLRKAFAGQFRVSIRSLLDFLGIWGGVALELPRLLLKRWHVQKARKVSVEYIEQWVEKGLRDEK